MRRTDAKRGWFPAALWVIAALILAGAAPKKKRIEGPPPKAEESIGDVAYIPMPSEQKLEGVGLVAGLDNTGADSPNSWYREHLIEDMRKAGVEDPNQILADPHFSMVIVKLKVPVGVDQTDRLDVELEVPPGCATKSLAGGSLISCRLRETLVLGGTPKEGPEQATAQGPVMVGSEAKPTDPKLGRVLGGGKVKKATPFNLVLKDSRRSFRTSALIEAMLNQRFPLHEGVQLKGVATAKKDTYLELKVPKVYHHNYYRYFRVVKVLPLVDLPALRQTRMEQWGKELMDPTKAGIAALKLEALGPTAADTLKEGLKSDNSQVRFLAAESLAYLKDDSGAEILGDVVIKEPKLRAHALAALAACAANASSDQTRAQSKLVKLMDVADVEVRYGAFDALRTLDENSPFLGRLRVIDVQPDPEEASESMAVALSSAYRRPRNAAVDPFSLYVIDCEGPPMIHLARTKRSEIVIFGRDQKLLTPIVLSNGPLMLNASDGDEQLFISKIVSAAHGEDEKTLSTLEVADAIRRVANLGAKYPDVVSLLQGANKQRNLSGPLVVDAVPVPTELYDQIAIFGKDPSKKDEELKKASLNSKKKGFFRRLFSGD